MLNTHMTKILRPVEIVIAIARIHILHFWNLRRIPTHCFKMQKEEMGMRQENILSKKFIANNH